MDMRLERARLNWTRSANSYTDQRHVERRMRGQTHVSTRPRAMLFSKDSSCADGGVHTGHDDDVAGL